MRTDERARSMRAAGLSFAKISDALGINLSYAYRCAGDVQREPPEETERTVVRRHPYNGGCSSASGLMAISMPRIMSIHGELAA